jgi:ribosomal protein S17E
MYKYYYCKHIKDNFYDIKININKLSYLIKKYDLEFNSSVKEYWMNNVKIVSDKNNINFYKICDKNIKYENEYLIQEYTSKVTEPFNFNETHLEDEYILYDNTINNIKIILKKYTDYITLEFESNNLINNNNFLCYNII